MDYSKNVKYAQLVGRLDSDLVSPGSREWGVTIITSPQGEPRLRASRWMLVWRSDVVNAI